MNIYIFDNLDIIHQKEVSMKKNRIHIMIVFLVIALSILACSGSISTAKISEIYLTANSDGSGNTTRFNQDQPFYCIVKVSNAPDDTALKAVWTAVEVEGVDPNFVLDEVELTTDGNNEFTFDLQNNNLWPLGKYKVDIYLNGNLDQTVEFEVQ